MDDAKQWFWLRWALAALAIVVEIRVMIPDYPWGTPFWVVACLDANGWLHEAFYIAVGFLVLIDLTYHWEQRAVIVRRLRVHRRTK